MYIILAEKMNKQLLIIALVMFILLISSLFTERFAPIASSTVSTVILLTILIVGLKEQRKIGFDGQEEKP